MAIRNKEIFDMKKINKTLARVVVIIAVLLSACNSDETLNLEPIGSVESAFFASEAEMEKAVKGIYQKVGYLYQYPGNQNNFIQQIFWFPSDDMVSKSPSSFATDNFDALNSSNEPLRLFFNYSYQLIARANIVLEKIVENGDIAYTKKPEMKNWHKGEALFLRSWIYFQLWNVFGTAPIVNERITDLANSYPPGTTGTELLDQAIKDLQEASTLLPANWTATAAIDNGRLTKSSALALRAKCLVFRGTVTKSNKDFTDAIADINAISGYSLMANYGQNFDVAYEFNKETLFEFPASNPSGNPNPFVAGGNDAFSAIGDIGVWWGPLNNRWNWIGNANVFATAALQNAYEKTGTGTSIVYDPRRQFVCNDVVNNNNILKYVQTNATYNTNPWVNGNGNGLNGGNSINNPRILRYADVMLLKAEALVRSGGSLSEAIGLINQLRDRARKSTYVASVPPSPLPAPAAVPVDRLTTETNSATVLDWVFEERRLELACEEGHRWFDLRRRHMAGEIDLKTWDFGHIKVGSGFQDKHIYFPFPGGEVTDNPNMKQNPGY